MKSLHRVPPRVQTFSVKVYIPDKPINSIAVHFRSAAQMSFTFVFSNRFCGHSSVEP